MLFDLNDKNIQKHLSEAEFGIERESLRISSGGRLAQTKHPFGDHRNIDRDFCENQVELIGDVFTTPEQLNAQLNALLDEVGAALEKNGELLWPFSNPPKFESENEIPVADFQGSQRSKSLYRYYLAEKYGKKKMLFSGIHLNLSFSEALLRAGFEQSSEENFSQYKNDLYLKLSARLTQYAGLVVFLTAASPVSDTSIGVESNLYSSIRCSEHGYWNTFTPILDYSSLPQYILSIARYIESGDLKAASELYYPVRLKPRGANSLEALLQNGVNHLELRVLDVNPLSRSGIFVEDIRFIHLLLLYLASLPEQGFDAEAQTRAIKDIKSAAVFGNPEIRLRAEKALGEIESFVKIFLPDHLPAVRYQLDKLSKGCSYAEIVSKRFTEGYMKKGIALAGKYLRGDPDV